MVLASSIIIVASGCHQPLFKNEPSLHGLFQRESDFATLLAMSQKSLPLEATVADRLAAIGGQTNELPTNPVLPNQLSAPIKLAQTSRTFGRAPTSRTIVRAQSPGYGESDNDFQGGQVTQAGGQVAQAGGGVRGIGSSNVQTGNSKSGTVQPVAFQYPELNTPDRTFIPGNGLNSPNIGSPNELNSLVQPYERGGNVPFPMNYADLDIYVTETQTGRINFGGAYNSDNGIVGQFTVDEKNFDIRRWPRNFREIVDGTAWRGGGQQFRMELVPGANVQRYLVSITEPYLLGTDYSFSASGYLFERAYFDWDEHRLGGRFSVGRRLTQDLSISAGLRLESVEIDNPRVPTSTQLNDTIGTSNLFLANVGLIRDTRDSTVAATEGSYLSMTFSQAFGDYDFSRGDLDYRRYKLLYERPDGSGRHTVSFGTKLGFSGSSTPIFENYFAGGFSTLRGFDFRGAAPLQGGVRVGGEFQWLNSLEYMFPITADDSIKGVVFCDFGTVEESIELNSENFRVAPGFGFRVSMPGAGIGAPLAFDFAFPVSTADGDEEKVFSFYLGVLR
jgi:outer membrane protein insertion porin family